RQASPRIEPPVAFAADAAGGQLRGVRGRPGPRPLGQGDEGPGLGALAAYLSGADFIFANSLSLSCPAAGNCGLAEGTIDQAFVASESNGAWRRAIRVAGAAPSAAVFAISCAAPGDCVAGGFFGARVRTGAIRFHAFVLEESRGTWGRVRSVF